jgi:membrane protein implicated in regulation of membrane protease activity
LALCGALGSAVLIVRLGLLAAGAALDGDGLAVEGHADPGDGFQVLSVHTLASFLMMFGLVGLALSRQSGVGPGWSILGGMAAGLGSVLLIARLFQAARGLQSSGNLSTQAAAGCLGTVYQRIPQGGTGRVTVRIGQRLREMDAIHAAGTELPTGTPVRVVRVEQVLAVVQPLPPAEV